MTQPAYRFLLVACCVIVQLHPPAVAKESKVKEKDIAGLTYAVFRNGSTPSKELIATLVQQLHWDNGGAGNLDRMAYHLRFMKVDETQTPEGNQARYRVFAEGAPENKVYGLGTWEVGQPASYSDQDVYVNAQGLVMTRRPNPDEEAVSQLPGVELYVSPKAIPGEPTRYAIASRDREATAYGTLVPHPVVSQDGGCRLEARIAAPGSSAVLVVADGFAAQMRLSFILESQGEIANVEVTTDHNGHAVVAGFPFIQGKTQGTLKATAEGKDCLPSVQMPWDTGTSAIQANKQH
jgi:hypothetical protein